MVNRGSSEARLGLGGMVLAVFVSLFALGCEPEPEAAPEPAALAVEPPTLQDAVRGAHRRLIYVPAYAYALDKVGRVHLTTTLLIHNVSSESVTIHSVRYYDAGGVLIDSKLDAPRRLAPLETVEFLHEPSPEAEGAGANFLVGWSGPDEPAPLIEALMAGHQGAGRLTFSARGVPVGDDPD